MTAKRGREAPMDAGELRLRAGGAGRRCRVGLAGAAWMAVALFAGQAMVAGQAAAQGAGEPALGNPGDAGAYVDVSTSFTEMPTSDLFDLFMDVGLELRNRKLLPQDWNPAQDYAEILVERALDLKKAAGRGRADGSGGVRYRIIGMRIDAEAAPRVTGLKPGEFDRLAVVLFEERFVIDRAAILPSELVASKTAGGALHLSAETLRGAGVEDVTAKVDRFTGDDFR